MAILKNIAFANKNLVTAFGKITFDGNGEVHLDDSAAEKLATLDGFSIVEETTTPDTKNAVETKSEQVADEVATDTVEEETADEVIDRDELEKMNVPQLRKYAKTNNIDISGLSKKDDIIDAILK